MDRPGSHSIVDELEKGGRIMTKDRNLYDIYHLVIEPRNITPDEILEEKRKIRHEFFSIQKCFQGQLTAEG